MQDVIIERYSSTDEGTFGTLKLESGWTCHTLELPWRDNRRRRSCIPVGVYHSIFHHSPRFGRTYWLQDVPGRSEILFHSGNWAGDQEKGFRTDSDGCILLGTSRGILSQQNAILNSNAAMSRMLRELGGEQAINLVIWDV